MSFMCINKRPYRMQFWALGWLVKYYAWVKPACSLVKAKGLSGPFSVFLGAFSECNTGFPQWRGLAETLHEILSGQHLILKKLICKKLTILCSHSNFNSLTHPGTSRAQACCRSVHLVKLKLLQRNCFRRIVLDLCAGISVKLFINACINVRPEGGDPGQMWGIWLFRRSFGQNPHYGAP